MFGKKKNTTESGNGFDHEQVGELMTTIVMTVTPNDSVANAARLMQDCDCGLLPVVDLEGRPIGVISDRDVALFIAPRGLNAAEVEVRDCMTDDLVTCRASDRADHCLQLMADHQVRRIPVVNDGGYLVGIVSQADLARDADAHAGKGKRRSVASMVSAISEPCLGS